jgi:hypothetical protein
LPWNFDLTGDDLVAAADLEGLAPAAPVRFR